MNIRLAISLILLLASTVSASTCQTFWDYCANITLPNVFYDDPSGPNTGIYTIIFSGITESTVDGVLYANSTLTNIYAEITNTTKYGWDGPYIHTSKTRIWLVSNTTNNLTSPAHIMVCLNGTYKNGYSVSGYPPGTGGPTAGTNTLDINDFVSYYHRNWTFRWEENNSIVNFSNQNSTLDVYCVNHQSFSFNLTANPGEGSLTIQTIEKPKYVLTYSGLIKRSRDDVEHNLRDDYYITTLSSTKYTISLADYTGGLWQGSTLYIQKSINDTWDNIEVQQFPTDNYEYVWLVNNTQYKFVLKTDRVSKDVDFFWPNGIDTTKTISVNQPILSDVITSYSDLVSSFTSDYNSAQVGAVVYSDDSDVMSYFNVSNTTGGTYVSTYGSNMTGNAIYSYTLPDRTQTVYIQLVLQSSRHGTVGPYGKLITLYNQSNPLNDSAFSAPLPSSVIGTSIVTLKKLVSLLLVWFILFIACKATDYGTGALVGAISYSFFWFVNWIPQTEVPFWFIAILGLIAAGLKLQERRYG